MASDDKALLQKILLSLQAQEKRHNAMQEQLAGLIKREKKQSTNEDKEVTTPHKQFTNEQTTEAETTPAAKPPVQRRRSPRHRSPRNPKPSTPVTKNASDSEPVERTSSLSKSLKEKKAKRTPKSQPEQTLRRRIGQALKITDDIDAKLLRGELHGSDGELDHDLLENSSDKLMKSAINHAYGSDHVNPEEKMVEAFALVLDVCTKRFRYKATKEIQTKIKKRRNARKTKRLSRKRKLAMNDSPAAKPQPRGKRKQTRRKQNKVNKDDKIEFNANYTRRDAESVLGTRRSPRRQSRKNQKPDDDDKTISCCNPKCKVVLVDVSQGFPESARESGMFLRCKDCHDQHVAELNANDKAAQQHREDDKNDMVKKKADAAAREAERKKAAAEKAAQRKKVAAEKAASKKKTKAAKAAAKKRAKAEKDAAKKKAKAEKDAAKKKAAAEEAAAKKKAAAEEAAAKKKAAAEKRRKPTDWDDWKFPIKSATKLKDYFRAAKVPVVAPRGRIFVYAFRPYANVLGFWPGDGKWYQAQVYGHIGHGRYKLYFPDDDAVYIGAPECHVREPPCGLWSKIKRGAYVGHDFEHKEQQPRTPSELGPYKVLQTHFHPKTGENMNQYMCEHKETGKKYVFNMGYVQRILLKSLAGEWAL